MSPVAEDSPSLGRASNSAHLHEALVEACLRAVRRTGGHGALGVLLESLVELCGAERAYVVRVLDGGADRAPVVEAFHGRRRDGDERPSRSVVRAALGRRRPLVCVDARAARSLVLGESVRELSLCSIVAAPLPAGRGPRRVLVLDSRARPRLAPERLPKAVEAFAALIALVRSAASPVAGAEPAADEDDGIVGESAAMRSVLAWVDRAAGAELPVLLRGETGSGKERLAARLHRRSRRRHGPFVAVNCTALPEALLEAELFGAQRGAYTGAERDRTGLLRRAHGGTLLLDEVGDMSHPMQAKLLRALQEKRVRPVGADADLPADARIVAATHRDLRALVRDGTFRADLFYRLAVVEVLVPPLRERLADLPRIVERLGQRLAFETGLDPPRLGPDAWRALRGHDWPGNVRELHAVLARALLRSGGDTIDAHHLAELAAGRSASDRRADGTLEATMLRSALDATGGSIAEAARRIGWTRQKLYRRMRALGVCRARGTEAF